MLSQNRISHGGNRQGRGRGMGVGDIEGAVGGFGGKGWEDGKVERREERGNKSLGSMLILMDKFGV